MTYHELKAKLSMLAEVMKRLLTDYEFHAKIAHLANQEEEEVTLDSLLQ